VNSGVSPHAATRESGFTAAKAFPEGATFFPLFARLTAFLLLLFVAMNLSPLPEIDFPEY